MRFFVAAWLGLIATGLSLAEKPAKEGSASRYGVAVDLKAYPQGKPKEALASVLKAIEAKKIDYLLAQLADPAFVDERVKRLFGGKFEMQVEDTRAKLDAFAVRQLKKFAESSEVTEEKDQATFRLKDVGDRAVNFKKIDGRWFLENQNKPGK